MVEQNRGGHLISRFAGRGNEPDPCDMKIPSLKQRIQELERRQEKTRSKRAWETLNWENRFSYVYDHGNHRGGVRNETLCRLGLQIEITECVGKVPSNYHGSLCSLGMRVSSPECVDKAPYYPEFHEVESMSVYDTDIEDVIEEEEGFVGKGGFGGEEDNIEDVVVVSNDLYSSMIQTTLSVDFEEDINTKSHELMWFGKSIISKVSKSSFKVLIGKKYQGYLKDAPMVDKLSFKTIKVRGRVIIKKENLMHEIQIWMLRVQGTSEANLRTSFFK
nr:hypothetical protein [Tanacetum cinerariifolium]